MHPESHYSPYLSNEELMEMLKSPVKEMKKDMDQYKKMAAQAQAFRNSAQEDMSTWDRQYQEQRAFKDMEDHLRCEMQKEVRKVEELVAFQMALLDKKADALQEKMEKLVTALVDQNRELSRRVTDLEWEGINP